MVVWEKRVVERVSRMSGGFRGWVGFVAFEMRVRGGGGAEKTHRRNSLCGAVCPFQMYKKGQNTYLVPNIVRGGTVFVKMSGWMVCCLQQSPGFRFVTCMKIHVMFNQSVPSRTELIETELNCLGI